MPCESKYVLLRCTSLIKKKREAKTIWKKKNYIMTVKFVKGMAVAM